MSTNSGNRACLRDGLGGGDERVRHSQHDIARLHTASHDGKAQSVGAAADGDRVSRIAEGRKCLFELLHHRAADEAGRMRRL